MADLKILQKNNKIILSNFERDFTFDNADEYVIEIKKIFDKYSLDLVADFKNVSYIDSNGIGQIVHIIKYLKETSHEFYMINVDESVARVLELSRLDKLFYFSRDSIIPGDDISDISDDETAFIISNSFTDKQKQGIRNILEKECVFLDFNDVNINNIRKKSDENLIKEKNKMKYKIMNSTNVEEVIKMCIECVDKKELDIFHEVILSHPDSLVRREVILASSNIKKDPTLLKIMKKAFLSETNDNIKKTISFTIDKLRKRNKELI